MQRRLPCVCPVSWHLSQSPRVGRHNPWGGLQLRFTQRWCRYLAEHQLEEVIADAMREVGPSTKGIHAQRHSINSASAEPLGQTECWRLASLQVIHEKPAEPLIFLSSQILKHVLR